MANPPVSLSLVHRTRFPIEPVPGALAHPTVLALHGRGADETDLLGLADYLDDRLLWVSPRAPLELEGGYEWYRLPGIGQPDPATFELGLAALSHFVAEVLSAYPVDPDQLYIVGFSQGCMVGYSYLLAQPDRIAGMVAHSGYLPIQTLEARGGLNPAGARGKPFLLAHGTRDTTIPVRWARESRDWLAAAGADVTYQEFPTRHQVTDTSLSLMDDWLRQRLDLAH